LVNEWIKSTVIAGALSNVFCGARMMSADGGNDSSVSAAQIIFFLHAKARYTGAKYWN